MKSMGEIKCPNCSRDFVRAVARRGIIERLLGLFSVYPYKCQLCGERFRTRQTRMRYVRIDEDRREYDRMEMRFPISFSSPDISGDGVMLNFSMAGCCFSTSAPIPVGTILQMKLNITPGVEPVAVEAGVVGNSSTGTVGVEFLRWEASERERLQRLVQGMLIGRGVGART